MGAGEELASSSRGGLLEQAQLSWSCERKRFSPWACGRPAALGHRLRLPGTMEASLPSRASPLSPC